MRLYAFVKVKIRIHDTSKSIEEIKANLHEHIKQGEFWIKEVEFKMQKEKGDKEVTDYVGVQEEGKDN